MWGESWKRGLVGNKAVAVTDLLRSPSLLTNCRLINSRLTNILLTNNMSTSSVFLISDAPCYSSVVITVFMIGIFDSFFFTVMLSVTNQGEISSRLVLACKVICIRYWYIDMFLQALQYWWHPSIVSLINWMLRWEKVSQPSQIFKKRLIVPKFVDTQATCLFWEVKAWIAQTISDLLFTREI